jgi:hypothetical protein
VKFEIIKLENLSGVRATVYSVTLNDETHTLFERFIVENRSDYINELKDISTQIRVIAHKTGIRDNFFDKPEGKFGQDIWALYDKPRGRLRLYCMQLGHIVIILGGGGPKNTRTLQEDPKLKLENDLMRMVSDALTQRIKDKEIRWSSDGTELIGDLIFDDLDSDEDR